MTSPDLAVGRTVKAGGYVGLVVAFLVAYLYFYLAEPCEASYQRSVLPVWPLVKH